MGAADSCMKHESTQGRKFCTDIANSSIVVMPDFSQLFHRPKRLRIAARVSGDHAAKARRFWHTSSKHALVGAASLTKYSDIRASQLSLTCVDGGGTRVCYRIAGSHKERWRVRENAELFL